MHITKSSYSLAQRGSTGYLAENDLAARAKYLTTTGSVNSSNNRHTFHTENKNSSKWIIFTPAYWAHLPNSNSFLRIPQLLTAFPGKLLEEKTKTPEFPGQRVGLTKYLLLCLKLDCFEILVFIAYTQIYKKPKPKVAAQCKTHTTNLAHYKYTWHYYVL